MKQLSLLLVAFLLLGNSTFAQKNAIPKADYIEKYVESLELSPSVLIEHAVITITRPFGSELEKTRAIYHWIAFNIRYDHIGRRLKTWHRYRSDEAIIARVYRLRRGICSGYARLFQEMLALADIDSKIVSGYARVDPHTTAFEKTNHAWNQVKIDGKWHLFDVTWARNGHNKTVDYFYFMTDPQIFILNHYPENYEFSLLEEIYSIDEYMQFPYYTNLFYELKPSEEVSKKGLYTASNDSIYLDLRIGIDNELILKWYNPQNKDWTDAQWNKNEQSGVISVYVPRKGQLTLRMGAITTTAMSTTFYDEVAYYRVENHDW